MPSPSRQLPLSPDPPRERPRRLPWWLGACAFGLLTPWWAHAWPVAAGGPGAWLVDLASHWQWLFLAGLVLGLARALFSTRWCLGFAVLLPLPFWTASPGLPSGQGEPVLTVASANLHVSTTHIGRLSEWLASADPDVVVLLEVSRALGPQFASLTQYPHQVVHAEDSPFGIAVLSRVPLFSPELRRDAHGIARIEVDLMVKQERIALVAFHPMPPINHHFHAARDKALREIASRLHAAGRPALLVGDLNATPWSSAFAGLEAFDLRRTTGLRPTWPAWGHGVFGIPIDHVLASRHWRVLHGEQGPDLGSDHVPLLVRLTLAPIIR